MKKEKLDSKTVAEGLTIVLGFPVEGKGQGDKPSDSHGPFIMENVCPKCSQVMPADESDTDSQDEDSEDEDSE